MVKEKMKLILVRQTELAIPLTSLSSANLTLTPIIILYKQN